MEGFGPDKNSIIQGKDSDHWLWLGNIWAAEEASAENQENFIAVLTVASGTELCFDKKKVRRMVIEAEDDHMFDLQPKFDIGADFIRDEIKKGNVFVHCFAGVSRSTSIVIAYLMKHHRMTLTESFRLVKTKRPIIGPNRGFMKQLEAYEKIIFSK